jgi:hypothetical protein
MRTEKSRLRRSLMSMQDLMRRMRHLPIREQVDNLNTVLRGHYAYYGIAGNFRALQKVHRAVECYWHKMLCWPELARTHYVGHVPPDQAAATVSPLPGAASSRSAVNHVLKSTFCGNRRVGDCLR